MSFLVGDSAQLSAPSISTPDRRLRVFVSSTLQELAAERQAVRKAITQQRLTPVMFELGARPHPPRDLYRAYLAQSDVFVGIYAESYGWVAPGEEVSGLEDEYLLSGDRPKLIYVKAGAHRQPRLEQLLHRVQSDDRASYKAFTDATELAELLADDLAVLLTERFTGSLRAGPLGLRRGRLPVAMTTLVGREREVSTVVDLLRDQAVRLVTLTGPGGIGKTRLALDVATRMADGSADSVGAERDGAERDGKGALEGVWFVDLTPVTDASRVVEVVAKAFGVGAEGTASLLELLIDRLMGHRVLVLLDNFEQVLDAAPDVARLLAECPGVTILVTSRRLLGLRGEYAVSLSPLATPHAVEELSVETLAGHAAVRLFVERARQVRPGFALTSSNAAAVAELCRRLDGIPLALELAAAQLRVLTPAGLLHRLADRLDQSLDLRGGLLDLPDRQRTLRATVDWSHSLLGASERALLARLSVFAQSWTLEAAEAVGAVDDDVDVLETMSSLVAQSLLTLDESDPDELRCGMLESVRSYARERLEERGERDATLDRLTGYLSRFAATAGAGLGGADNRRWGERVDDELEDLLGTMQRAVQNDDAETIVRIAAPLFTYWWSRGLLGAMRTLAEQAAALPSAARLPAEAAALLTWARGMNRISVGETEEAEQYLNDLLTAATAMNDARLRAFALAGLALTPERPDLAERRELLKEAVATMRSLGDQWGLAFALSVSGQLALQSGDPVEARAQHVEALTAAEAIDHDHLRAQLQDLLGLDTLAAGDVAEARDRFARAAEIHSRLLDQEGSAVCLQGLASIALAQGRPQVSARLLGAAARARERVGVSIWPGLQLLASALVSGVRGALGEASFNQAGEWGATLSLSQALDYALSATAPPEEDTRAAAPADQGDADG